MRRLLILASTWVVSLKFALVAVLSPLLISSEKRSGSSAQASLGDSLTSKKWSTHTSRTVMTVGDTFADDGDDGSADVDVESVESQMSSSEVTPMSDDKEAASVAMSAHKDGSVCAICNKEYSEGEGIYESNNPRCGHEFHQECMNKWLAIQNACPICTRPFVLQQAG
jgi:Ring finger domain